MPASRSARTLLVASAAALVAAGAAWATSLSISPAHLTVYAAASSITPTTCALGASSADAYVDGSVLTSGTNFGSATDLLVQSSALGNRRSLVRFDLSSCSIPATARVTSASLDLSMSQAPGTSRTYEARGVTASWGESTVTWSNQPSVAGSATSTTATGTSSGVTLSWNVATDIQAFIGGTANNGWRIADTSEGALVAVGSTFGARERASAAERPRLVVAYYP